MLPSFCTAVTLCSIIWFHTDAIIDPEPTDSEGTSSNFELDKIHYIIGGVILLAIVVVIGIAAVVSYKVYKTRRITRQKATEVLAKRLKECEQHQVDLAQNPNPTPQSEQTLKCLQESQKCLQKEYERRLATDTAEEGNEDNTCPEVAIVMDSKGEDQPDGKNNLVSSKVHVWINMASHNSIGALNKGIE